MLRAIYISDNSILEIFLVSGLRVSLDGAVIMWVNGEGHQIAVREYLCYGYRSKDCSTYVSERRWKQ